MISYRAHSLCFRIPTCQSLKSRSLPAKLIPEWRFPGACHSSSSNNHLAYFPCRESPAKASCSQLVSSLHSPSLGCQAAKSKQRQPTLTGAKGLTKTYKCIIHLIRITPSEAGSALGMWRERGTPGLHRWQRPGSHHWAPAPPALLASMLDCSKMASGQKDLPVRLWGGRGAHFLTLLSSPFSMFQSFKSLEKALLQWPTCRRGALQVSDSICTA